MREGNEIAMANIAVLTEAREILVRRLIRDGQRATSTETLDMLENAFAKAIKECADKIDVTAQDDPG